MIEGTQLVLLKTPPRSKILHQAMRSIVYVSIEIVESKFLKLGYLRSESTTADQPQSRPVREQHLTV